MKHVACLEKNLPVTILTFLHSSYAHFLSSKWLTFLELPTIIPQGDTAHFLLHLDSEGNLQSSNMTFSSEDISLVLFAVVILFGSRVFPDHLNMNKFRDVRENLAVLP